MWHPYAAYFYSLMLVLFGAMDEQCHGEAFIETSAMITMFVLFGKYLEVGGGGGGVGGFCCL